MKENITCSSFETIAYLASATTARYPFSHYYMDTSPHLQRLFITRPMSFGIKAVFVV